MIFHNENCLNVDSISGEGYAEFSKKPFELCKTYMEVIFQDEKCYY